MTTIETLQLRGSLAVTASVAERTISGTICEYGVVGNTSLGPTIFEAGSLTVPTPVSKAKMLVQHDSYAAAVGLMASFTPDPKLPRGTFHIPASAAGDQALVEAANGLREGLSVGCHIDEYAYNNDGVLVVKAGRIFEVSLVTIPAYENAGVTSVAAAHKEGNKVTEEVTTPTVEAAATPAPITPAPATAVAPVVEAQAPAIVPPGITTNPRGLTIAAAAAIVVEHLRAGRPAATIVAALSDTVPGGDVGNGFVNMPVFLGELWRASNIRRPMIEALGTPKPLTGLKAYGWGWGVPPTVPEYAGDKGAVHSEALTTILIEAAAKRFAGGWDIDRVYIDLGAAGFIEAVFDKAIEDYRKNTEADVAAQLVAFATAQGAKASLTDALSAIGASAVSVGFNVDHVAFSPTLWGEFINLDEDEVPWWLKAQGKISLGTSEGEAGGLSFSVSSQVGTRGYLAFDQRAADFHEVDPPVRVQALDIAKGGVDLGVFGYTALVKKDARAVVKGTVTAPA